MRTLTFQFISDSRFGGNEKKLKEMDKSLKIELAKLPGIILKEGVIRKLTFGEPEPCISWRKRYYIEKDTRTPWNKIYEAVNPIQAPSYKFMNN